MTPIEQAAREQATRCQKILDYWEGKYTTTQKVEIIESAIKLATKPLEEENKRLQAELTLHNHRCEAAHNEGLRGMPQGDCQCVICRPFYNENKRLGEALEFCLVNNHADNWGGKTVCAGHECRVCDKIKQALTKPT